MNQSRWWAGWLWDVHVESYAKCTRIFCTFVMNGDGCRAGCIAALKSGAHVLVGEPFLHRWFWKCWFCSCGVCGPKLLGWVGIIGCIRKGCGLELLEWVRQDVNDIHLYICGCKYVCLYHRIICDTPCHQGFWPSGSASLPLSSTLVSSRRPRKLWDAQGLEHGFAQARRAARVHCHHLLNHEIMK